MAQRFVYDRPSTEYFRRALGDVGMSAAAFARVFCFNGEKVRQWWEGTEDVDPKAFMFLELVKEFPEALPAARRLVAEILREDRERPHLGAYPYKTLRGED